MGGSILSFRDYLGEPRLSLRETLLSWKGVRIGKRQKKVWQASPFRLFWTVWRVRNSIACKNEESSIQRLKSSFVSLLWSETKLSMVDGPSTLIGFIDWAGCK